MKESYRENPASCSGLEPYADDGDIVGVASARGDAGQPSSSEIKVPCADLVQARRRQHRVRRHWRGAPGRGGVVDPEHVSKFQAREPGDPAGLRRTDRNPVGEAERSENVNDGTADMDASRKSDGPIVPARRANKAGTPAAESAEERGPLKGNALVEASVSDTEPKHAEYMCESCGIVRMKTIPTAIPEGGAV